MRMATTTSVCRHIRLQHCFCSRDLAFFHINDVHAHLDEFSSSGTDCTRPERGCYGGYARVKTVIEEQRPNYEDSLWLNAGDEFQGTLFYSFYGGEKIAETLNQLEFDAMTLGNHEFDGGDAQLVVSSLFLFALYPSRQNGGRKDSVRIIARQFTAI